MSKNNPKSPKGKMVEIEGIRYLLIDGKIYRYADLTLNKGFKIVLGRPGSEEVLKHLLNRLLGLRIARLEYRNTEHPGMDEGRAEVIKQLLTSGMAAEDIAAALGVRVEDLR